jgi:quinol monooxygenase YgiN
MFSRCTAHWIMLAMLMLALVVSVASAQEKENPLLTQIRASLKDPNKPFTMMVMVRVKEGAEKQFEEAFAKAIRGTRQEKGNRAYDLNRDAKMPTAYVVYERWQDLAALEAHLRTPHITTLLAEIGDLLAAPPEGRAFIPAGE